MESSILQQLKLELAKRFGKNPETHKDLAQLVLDIQEETGVLLGFNTLRRFYGKLEARHPQLKTLNILSNYLGHKTFYDFTRHCNQFEEWYVWKKMIGYENKQSLRDEDLNWLNAIKNRNEFPVMISSLIKSYIGESKTELLHKLFASDCLMGLDYKEQMKIGNTVGLYLRKTNPETWKQLSPLITYYPFRNILFYLFIDYDSFNGYYGNLLTKVPIYTKDFEERLFQKLILNYKKHLSCQSKPENLSDLQLKKDIHPILIGRYWGYVLVTSSGADRKAALKGMMLYGKRTTPKISYFLEVVPALILAKEIKTLETIYNLHFSELFELKHWSQHDEQSLYKIGLSIVYCSQNLYSKSVVMLEQIDTSLLTDSYVSYVSLFLKIAEYQTKKGLKCTTSELSAIENEYMYFVEKTGFKRFTKALLKNYFNSTRA